MKAALGGGDFLALAIFCEEFLTSFEVCSGSDFFAALEHFAKGFHGSLEFLLVDFRLPTLECGHESLEEIRLIEICSTHAKLSKLLSKSAASAEAERIRGIRLDHRWIEFRLGRHFDSRSGSFRLSRSIFGGIGGGDDKTEGQCARNKFTNHGCICGRLRKIGKGSHPVQNGFFEQNTRLFHQRENAKSGVGSPSTDSPS